MAINLIVSNKMRVHKKMSRALRMCGKKAHEKEDAEYIFFCPEVFI